MLIAVGRRSYIKGLNLEKISVEVNSRVRIGIDDQFNTSVPKSSVYVMSRLVLCSLARQSRRASQLHTLGPRTREL